MRIEKKECPLQNCSVVSWRAKNWSSCEIMSSEKSFYGSFCYRGSQTRVVECVSWQNGSISGTVEHNHDHSSWLGTNNLCKNRLILHFVRKREDQFKPRHVRYGAKRIACLRIGVNGWTAIVILALMGFKVSVNRLLIYLLVGFFYTGESSQTSHFEQTRWWW